MPLIKSYTKDAFVKNIKVSRKEDKPVPQAIAIAYDVARRAVDKAGMRETERMRKAWREAIADALRGTSKKPKAAKKPAKRKVAKKPAKRKAAKKAPSRSFATSYIVCVTRAVGRSGVQDLNNVSARVERAAKGARLWVDRIRTIKGAKHLSLTFKAPTYVVADKAVKAIKSLGIVGLRAWAEQHPPKTYAVKKAPKKAAKKPAKKRPETALQMIANVGPPSQWSGAAAAFLGPVRRKIIQSKWKTMTPAQHKAALAAFHKKMCGAVRGRF